MANRPRNIALPVILAIGIAVVGFSLLPFRDGDGAVESLPAESVDSVSTEEAPDVSAEAASTINRAVETSDPDDKIAAISGEVSVPSKSASVGSDTGRQRPSVATGAPDEPDRRSPSSSRRNVIAGGSNRGVSSGSTGSAAGSVGSSTRGAAAVTSAASDSEATPLTVFAEQAQAGGAGRQGAAAGASGSTETESAPVSDAADRAATDVAEELTGGDTPDAARSGQEKREDPGAASEPYVRMHTPTEVFVGDSMPVIVRIAEGTDVGHVPFHVTFNPQVVRFEYGEEGFYLGSDGNQTAFFAAPTSDGSAVVIGLSRLGRVAGVGGGGDLCVLHFTATGPGDAALSFVRAKVRDSANRIVPSVFVPASVTVRE